ncbi:hypothetical protein KDW_06800 [Dictyobacter vulcani]|uniref:NACHT domain-containing protein n=1 Tax=Dictyobacter vulcani TaxID=2607529 RepID=A0A5J4KCK7_9CHLR|nr:hypothetical protein [Dictyobacter vulcani]GER86518.1 hypothetical protein KDW_06800 [Dictyobacter vulcani]
MANMQKFDGGQVALIGFLYQVVGTLSLLAMAESPKVPVEHDNLEALLAIIHDGEVYHERNDVDALAHRLGVDQPDTYVLIQFKYSQNPERDPITPGKLAEICEGFLRGLAQWPAGAHKLLFRVITNRSISSTLYPVLTQPEGRRKHPLFEQAELHDILQKTEILERYDFSPFEAALRSFANDYGVSEEEFERGLYRLIGMLVERATKHYAQPIYEEDLVKAFCSYAHLRKLTRTAIREYTSYSRKDVMHILGLREMPVQRTALLEKAMIMLKQHSFLIFQGPGGSGKSVLAWHVLQNILEEVDEKGGAATAFIPLRSVQSLSWIVGEWMGVPEEKRTEPMEQVIQRIMIANPNVHPVLCLGIDGLDEKNEMTHGYEPLRQIISWFWKKERELQFQQAKTGKIEPPDATLIVTCRERSLLDNFLNISLWAEMKENDAHILSVSDYSTNELLQAVEQVLFPYLERFKQTLSDQSHPTMTLPLNFQAFEPPIHHATLDALRHPAMWYALRKLPKAQQACLLDGEEHAFLCLAKFFLEWFSVKVQKRRPEWGKEHISEALEEIARIAYLTRDAQFDYRIWKEVGRKGCRLEGRAVSEDLYQEAQSAGLISEWEPRKVWTWRHPFVGIYLARLALEKE